MKEEQKNCFKDLKEAIRHGAIYPEKRGTVSYSYQGKKYTVKLCWEPRNYRISLNATPVDEKENEAKESVTKNKNVFKKAVNDFIDFVDLNQNFYKVTVTDYSAPQAEPQEFKYRGSAALRLFLYRRKHSK